MLRTFNDVHDSRAKKMCGDGLSAINFTEPCHQVVRFVYRAVLIEPLDLHVCGLHARRLGSQFEKFR